MRSPVARQRLERGAVTGGDSPRPERQVAAQCPAHEAFGLHAAGKASSEVPLGADQPGAVGAGARELSFVAAERHGLAIEGGVGAWRLRPSRLVSATGTVIPLTASMPAGVMACQLLPLRSSPSSTHCTRSPGRASWRRTSSASRASRAFSSRARASAARCSARARSDDGGLYPLAGSRCL